MEIINNEDDGIFRTVFKNSFGTTVIFYLFSAVEVVSTFSRFAMKFEGFVGVYVYSMNVETS